MKMWKCKNIKFENLQRIKCERQQCLIVKKWYKQNVQMVNRENVNMKMWKCAKTKCEHVEMGKCKNVEMWNWSF